MVISCHCSICLGFITSIILKSVENDEKTIDYKIQPEIHFTKQCLFNFLITDTITIIQPCFKDFSKILKSAALFKILALTIYDFTIFIFPNQIKAFKIFSS